MFGLAWFGLGFTTTSIPLDSWTWLVELVELCHTGEEAQAMAEDTASTISYADLESDSTEYDHTTISFSETDSDDETDPPPT